MTTALPSTIAVTGAGGFIGRHLLEELIQYPVKVVAVDRDIGRLSEWSTKVAVVQMDIARPPSDCFVQLGCPDILIHLAWDGLPNYKSPHHFESELPRQYHFLKTIVEAGLPSLLVTGTCFEYGMQSGALSEDLPTCPNNPYGYAKDALRRQLEFLRQVHPFIFTWTRLFYLYGEGQSKSSLYIQIKQAVLQEQRSFNMSGGEQLRDYLPIGEVARLIAQLAIRKDGAGVVNVCSGKPVSVRRLVEGWIEENGWKIKLNLGHHPYPDYEPMAFWGLRTRLDSILKNSGVSTRS
jgi:nucleoside-diphosphate-sugar epimerase